MRYRAVDPTQIPPAQGDAEKLIENLAADYEKFYALQEDMLRGPRRPPERFARKAVRGLSAHLFRFTHSSLARVAAAVCLTAALGLALFSVYLALPKERPVATEYVFPASVISPAAPAPALDARDFVNRATQEELAQIPGIGKTLAARIIAAREKDGPFAFVEDILLIPGIGKAKLNAITAYMDRLND